MALISTVNDGPERQLALFTGYESEETVDEPASKMAEVLLMIADDALYGNNTIEAAKNRFILREVEPRTILEYTANALALYNNDKITEHELTEFYTKSSNAMLKKSIILVDGAIQKLAEDSDNSQGNANGQLAVQTLIPVGEIIAEELRSRGLNDFVDQYFPE